MTNNQNSLSPLDDNDFSAAAESLEHGSRRFVITTSIIVFLCAIIFGLVWWFIVAISKNSEQNNIDYSAMNASSTERLLAERAGRPIFGNKDAKLVIAEFADFQCQFCRQEFPIIREIISQNQNDLLFIYRPYPAINDNSIILNQAAYCAQEQGKFWAFHDKMFLGTIPDSVDSLVVIGQSAGLDGAKLKTCLSTEKYKGQVAQDAQDGVALGVSGTPTFVVNGYVLPGVITKEQWLTIINAFKQTTNNQ